MTEQHQSTIKVTRKDLPLSCPPKGANDWSEHPRVFLDVKKTGKALCQYCGAHYELVD